MKKLFIGLAGVILLTFVIVVFVNARESSRQVPAPQSEVKTCVPKESSQMKCRTTGTEKTQGCNPASCPGHSMAAPAE